MKISKIYTESTRKGVQRYLRRAYPDVPRYVFKDVVYNNFMYNNAATWLYAVETADDLGTSIYDVLKSNDDFEDYQELNDLNWSLHVLDLKPTDFCQKCLKGFEERRYGFMNAWGVRDDFERFQIQRRKIQGHGNNEPVVLKKTKSGFSVIEGWHRTMALLLLGFNDSVDDLGPPYNYNEWSSVKIKAWVGY